MYFKMREIRFLSELYLSILSVSEKEVAIEIYNLIGFFVCVCSVAEGVNFNENLNNANYLYILNTKNGLCNGQAILFKAYCKGILFIEFCRQLLCKKKRILNIEKYLLNRGDFENIVLKKENEKLCNIHYYILNNKMMPLSLLIFKD